MPQAAEEAAGRGVQVISILTFWRIRILRACLLLLCDLNVDDNATTD